MLIHEQLQELLKGKGISKKELSRLSGVPEATIYRLLRGEPVGSDKLEAIAKATDTLLRFVQK